MSARVLVLYASRHGQAARIAQRIGDVLAADGATVVRRDVHHDAGDVVPTEFDGVVVGGSVHRTHHDHELLAWIERHHTSLNLRPSAFFSVSLTAAEDSDEARATTRDLIDDVVDATGWCPTVTAAFAGALMFTRYDFPTRVVMRLIAAQHSDDVDITRDVEYTDWDAVEAFAHAFGARVARHAETAGAGRR